MERESHLSAAKCLRCCLLTSAEPFTPVLWYLLLHYKVEHIQSSASRLKDVMSPVLNVTFGCTNHDKSLFSTLVILGFFGETERKKIVCVELVKKIL